MLSGFFSAAALISNALVEGVYHYWWGYYPRYGWLGAPLLVFFFGLAFWNLKEYSVAYRRARPRRLSGADQPSSRRLLSEGNDHIAPRPQRRSLRVGTPPRFH